MKTCNKISLLVLSVILAGCSTSGQRERWIDVVDGGYSTDVPADRASVVFYRQADALDGPTVNIYTNNQYMGSLQPNAYRQEIVCAKNQRFFAEFTKWDKAYLEKASKGNYYNLPEGAVSFFRVVKNENGHPELEAVSPEQAESEMKGVKRQNHTLSRVSANQDCSSFVMKKYTLEASALFYFNKSSYQDMLQKGKEEIAAIAQEIQQNAGQIGGISVIGHTDPEGRHDYNDKLSYQRAATVKQALEENGVSSHLILPEGKGARELVISNCRVKYPNNAKDRQECDQPNRRVEIVVHGLGK